MSEERTVDVDDLAALLDELIDFVENGGRVVVLRDGKRVARLLPPLVD